MKPPAAYPALFTNTSIRPKCSMAPGITESTSLCLVTSSLMYLMLASTSFSRALSSNFSFFDKFRIEASTLYPALANARLVNMPNPPEAPVIKTTGRFGFEGLISRHLFVIYFGKKPELEQGNQGQGLGDLV